ncbi:MAG: cation:proton antiporter [Miltoncostaeaceae bacterium]
MAEDHANVALILGALGVAALILAGLARFGARVGISPIPFYLLAGLGLGSLGFIEIEDTVVEVGSEIGVVLLLFMLGLEYTSSELRSNLQAGLPAGLVDLALNFPPGFLMGMLLGWDFVAALLLGGVTYISSSGIIAKVLTDLDRLGNRETPSVLSLLVLEDLAMAVYLPLVAALLVGGTALATVGEVGIALAAAAVALIVALRYGERLSRLVAHRSEEVVLLTTFGLILLVAGVADELQVSSAVGAFLVGVALSGPVAEEARRLLGPLRDLFAATFFVFFGLGVAVDEIPGVIVLALVLAVVTATTKIITGWWATRRAGVGLKGQARASAALVSRGEFSIVIAALGVAAGAEAQLGPLAAAYVLILALAGPLLARFSGVLEPLLALLGRERASQAKPVPP